MFENCKNSIFVNFSIGFASACVHFINIYVPKYFPKYYLFNVFKYNYSKFYFQSCLFQHKYTKTNLQKNRKYTKIFDEKNFQVTSCLILPETAKIAAYNFLHSSTYTLDTQRWVHKKCYI